MEPPAVNVKGTETTDNKKKKTLFEDLKQNSNDANNDGIPLRLKDINLEIHSADSLSQIEIDDDLRNSRHLPGVHIVANNIFNQHTNVGPFILKDNNFPEKGKGTYRKTRTHIPAISEISYNPEVKESTTAEGIQDKKIAEIGHLRNYTAIATAGIIGWLLAIVLLVERIISLCVKKKQGRGISDSTISRKDETTKIKFAEVEAKENQILKSTELLPSTEPDRRGSSPIYP
ncbi:uncharacterized protein LOC121928888 isoform X2 [Sceloporus undulatus]|nr:uncharacterized protein LOC121928888 isoform X2 [Sceloporus undulatus]